MKGTPNVTKRSLESFGKLHRSRPAVPSWSDVLLLYYFCILASSVAGESCNDSYWKSSPALKASGLLNVPAPCTQTAGSRKQTHKISPFHDNETVTHMPPAHDADLMLTHHAHHFSGDDAGMS